MVKRQVKEIDEKEIARYKGYLSDNKTLSEIGLLEGVTKQAISERLKKMGLTPTKTKLTKSQLDVTCQVNLDPADLGATHKHPSAGNDQSQPTVSLPDDFLLVVQYTAQAQKMCDSWRPSDTINYLKDKDKIIQAQEVAKQSLIQLSVTDLLAVIKPGVSWPADRSLSINSSSVSNSTTSSVSNNE